MSNGNIRVRAAGCQGAPLLVRGGRQKETTMKMKLSKKAMAIALALAGLAGVG
jgi:hypothetical protein